MLRSAVRTTDVALHQLEFLRVRTGTHVALTFISLPRMSTFSILQLSSTFSTENDNFLYPSLPTPNPHTKFLGVALIPLNIYTSRLFFTIVQKTNVFCCLLNYGIMFVRRSSCICYFRRYDSRSQIFVHAHEPQKRGHLTM